MTTLAFQRLDHGADLPLPVRATEGSAGMDICAAVSTSIPSGQHRVIPTGFNVAIPVGHEVQVRPRSGLAAKHGITVLNSPGTIDSDYRGEIKVNLINHGTKAFNVKRGDRIAQLVVAKVECADSVEVDKLDDTERGQGGFGSTGV